MIIVLSSFAMAVVSPMASLVDFVPEFVVVIDVVSSSLPEVANECDTDSIVVVVVVIVGGGGGGGGDSSVDVAARVFFFFSNGL